MKRYEYQTDCVHSTADLICPMVDNAEQVTLATLRRQCEGINEWAQQMGYSVGAERGLHLKDDWSVSFHKSTYGGHPCYYIDHSRIEHVWILTPQEQ